MLKLQIALFYREDIVSDVPHCILQVWAMNINIGNER